MNLKKILSGLLFIGMLTGCSIPDSRIKTQMWKQCAGIPWADVLVFDQPQFHISNDTIYEDQTALYYILKREHRILANDDLLILQNLETSQVAVFCNK